MVYTSSISISSNITVGLQSEIDGRRQKWIKEDLFGFVVVLVLNSSIQYFNELNLKTNPSKSAFIQFCLRQTTSDSNPTIMLDDTEIEEVYSTKFLGIHLDRGLTWESHVDSVCGKLASGIYVLRQLSEYCPINVYWWRRITEWSTHTSPTDWLCGVVAPTQISQEPSFFKTRPFGQSRDFKVESRADQHSNISNCWHYLASTF